MQPMPPGGAYTASFATGHSTGRSAKQEPRSAVTDRRSSDILYSPHGTHPVSVKQREHRAICYR